MYCTSLCIYSVAAIAGIVVFAVLLRVHKDGLKSSWREACKKPKTWILIIGIVLNVLLFLNYFFRTPEKISLVELFSSEICRLIIYVALFHYFVKAAANLVGKGQAQVWRDRLSKLTLAILILWGIFLCIYAYLAFTGRLGRLGKGACKFPMFIIEDIFILAVCIAFCCAGNTITAAIKEEQRVASTGASSSTSSFQLLRARNQALRNMWIIIWTTTICASYDLLYSLCTMILQDQDCHP